MKRLFPLAMVVFLTLVACCDEVEPPPFNGVNGPDAWPYYRLNLQLTGATDSGCLPKGQEVWRVNYGGASCGTPILVKKTIYYCDHNSTLHALKADNGELLWRLELAEGPYYYAHPIIGENLLFITNAQSELLALIPETGEVVWRQTMEGYEARGIPAVYQGVVFCGPEGTNSLYAFDAQTGNTLWEVELACSYNCGTFLLPFDDTLYYCYEVPDPGCSWMGAIDIATGDTIWTRCFDGYLGIHSYFEGYIYVGQRLWDDEVDKLLVIQPSDGTTEKEFLIQPTPRAISIVDGIGYGPTASWGIKAIDLNSGEVLWEEYFPDHMSLCAVADGVVYSTCNNGTLYALDASSGKTLWSYTIGTGCGGHPIVIDGFIFLGNRDGDFIMLQ